MYAQAIGTGIYTLKIKLCIKQSEGAQTTQPPSALLRDEMVSTDLNCQSD